MLIVLRLRITLESLITALYCDRWITSHSPSLQETFFERNYH